jgi:preprotein translocase subunit YajC
MIDVFLLLILSLAILGIFIYFYFWLKRRQRSARQGEEFLGDRPVIKLEDLRKFP